ncbi:MAG: cobalamin-binding protein [Burkholderiaceae bacterium]|nr:cobalamin-binding protein [Burkholderiaceae bacterium]
MPASLIRLLTALWMLATWATAAGATAPASRVISLTPHITELIYAAGGGDKLVATVSSSDYPPEARKLPRIGDGLSVNIESLLAMHPDLVIAWHSKGVAQALAPTLQRLSIPLHYIEPRRLIDIPQAISHLGVLMGTQTVAKAKAQALNNELDMLRQRYAGKAPITVFIEVGTAPLYTIGNDPLINDMLHTCGGVNVYTHSTLTAPLISTEDVLARQPEVVIIGSVDSGQLATRRLAWSHLNLKAAIAGHVYALDPDALFRPGPRLFDAAQALCAYLDTVRQQGQ